MRDLARNADVRPYEYACLQWRVEMKQPMWRNSEHKAQMTAISLRCASRLAMLLVLACTSALALADTVRIGVAAPLSGDIEHLRQGIVQGAKMAVDDINASGGVRVGTRRIKLELIVADDKADPRTAVEVAHRLISDGAVAVVGHLNSGCSIPAAHLYGAGRVVQISPSSSNPLYTALKLDTAFRVEDFLSLRTRISCDD
jgi:branched-chain amino acid transport system substrate-binding protein